MHAEDEPGLKTRRHATVHRVGRALSTRRRSRASLHGRGKYSKTPYAVRRPACRRVFLSSSALKRLFLYLPRAILLTCIFLFPGSFCDNIYHNACTGFYQNFYKSRIAMKKLLSVFSGSRHGVHPLRRSPGGRAEWRYCRFLYERRSLNHRRKL